MGFGLGLGLGLWAVGAPYAVVVERAFPPCFETRPRRKFEGRRRREGGGFEIRERKARAEEGAVWG